ncbi:GAF domain-containing sensor histidine kinase [Stigmatella aurantiaca]|uniref:histidine kinase n=1 Tax=Stigmatella aurantiaca (strain DW4/3-1) TaxID=378806 RepID=E3FSG2_STIAD|nr:ATP-binding protein [Stigmatella aurantiaca]ADO72073.1 Sensor protein [Stigmatella aurantiaca DW4/3-1]
MAKSLQRDDKRLLQFRKLTEVSRALTYAVSLEEVLRLTVERAAELLETDKAVLMLTNEQGLLSVRAAFGLSKEATERFREPLDETLIHRLQGLLGANPECFLGVPLVVGGQVTGILAVSLLQPVSSNEEQEWLLSALADQAAVALEKTRLDETAEFRERLIGIVSHDLRGPISAILLGSTALLRREELSERDSKTVVRIQSAAERANRMIRDLLDYTQARLGGGIRVESRPMDLHAVVRQVVEEMAMARPERRIEVYQEGDVHGNWDVDRLAQVVGNLISNALHYSPEGTPVRVATVGDAREATLTIHNLGPPIPAQQQSKIFEPMQRASADMNPENRSVGLGLYIVRHLVKAHGGTIEVKSLENEGTTFTVRLPRQAPPLS